MSMERSKLGLQSLAEESGSGSASFSGSGFSPDQSRLLVRSAAAGRVVSLSTCSKICAVSFALGVCVGFTINRRFRRWINKLLRQLRDD